MPRAVEAQGRIVLFWCPGCDSAHQVRWNADGASNAWSWNGDTEAPTFQPSVLVMGGPPGTPRCHSFVTDGRIQYLPDSEHPLAGQTVDLPDWPYGAV